MFIAFELPDAVRDALEAEILSLEAARAEVRWSSRDHLHVTLRFLGEVPEASIPGLERMLADACRREEPMDLEVRGLGSFPSGRTPRVVWAGVKGSTERSQAVLHRLQRLVDEGAQAHGFLADRQDFHAHVTLGRLKGTGNARALTDLLRAARDREIGQVRVDEIVLFQSTLTKEGSIYAAIRRASLGPGHSSPPDAGIAGAVPPAPYNP